MSRFAYCIFCDDVRQEVSGKTSLIGVYQGKLIVEELPAAIAKLFAIIHVVTPKGKPFKSLDVKIEYNGQVMFDLPDTENLVKRLADHAGDDEDEIVFQAQVAFSPLHLEKTGRIKVKVMADGKKIACHGLLIEADPNFKLNE